MKKTGTVLLVFLSVLLLVQAAGLAWMTDNGLSSPIDITSNVYKTYFEGGNGTKEAPYEISTALQLYYFAWLQYLGYFNQVEDGVIEPVYFVLANDVDMHVTKDNGEVIEYVLPPIGTTDNPFLGNFDGAGYTVKNATVENFFSSLVDPPDGTKEENYQGVEIIGFFGVVGSLPEDKDKYTYDRTANEVKNLVLEDLTVKTQTDGSLIGLVAGYVNGFVDCVGVVGGTVNIEENVKALSYTANISDYSLVGYCTEDYKDCVYVMDVVLSNPGVTDFYNVVPNVGGDGETTGWGGSVAMKNIFNLIKGVSTTSNSSFTTQRVDVSFCDKKTVTVSSTPNSSSLNVASVSKFGSFVFTNMTSSATINGKRVTNEINFLAGAQKVTKFEYAYTNRDVPLYFITDGNNYLSVNGTTITNATNENDATAWYVSGGEAGGAIYTVINDVVYYLTITNNALALTYEVAPNAAPTWTVQNGALTMNSERIEYANNAWRIAIATTYLISSGSNYLSVDVTTDNQSGDVSVTLANKNNANSATKWQLDLSGNTTTIYTLVDGIPYYLGRNGTSLAITTESSNWTYSSSNNRFSQSNYYLRYNSGWTLRNGANTNTSGVNMTLTEVWTEADGPFGALDASSETVKELTYGDPETEIDNSVKNQKYNINGELTGDSAGITYIPLSFTTTAGQYTVSDKNTGYIIATQWGVNDDEYNSRGNIRISRYDIAYMPNYKTPLTITYKTYKEDNAAGTDVGFHSIAETPTAAIQNALGLRKYIDCYTNFRQSITGDNYSYGLHFMQATVSMENLVSVDVKLKNEDYSAYQMPANCIDFNLYDRGFINFVAGSYYNVQNEGVNNSFFSIYKIERDDQDKITAIKEIHKVYGKLTPSGAIDSSQEYVYAYSENATAPAGYELIFDCAWITNSSAYSGWELNSAYYFEVPVNKGEYAIGSTANKLGAYLVYLDLAANAQLIEREKEYEKIETEDAAAEKPNGVELLAPTENTSNVAPAGSAYVSITTNEEGKTAVSGDITYETADGKTITYSATSGVGVQYIGNNVVLKNGAGTEVTLPSVKTIIERTTYRDYNVTTGLSTVTVITKTTVIAADGTETVSYKRTITKPNGEGGVTVDEDEEMLPEAPDSETALESAPGNPLVHLYAVYKQDVPLTATYLYVPESANEGGTGTVPAEYQITVTNKGSAAVTLTVELTQEAVDSGMTFVINGQKLTNSTAVQTVEIAATGNQSGGDAA